MKKYELGQAPSGLGPKKCNSKTECSSERGLCFQVTVWASSRVLLQRELSILQS